MALHFVSTSILSSEDGIDFSKEQVIESEQVKKARILSERGSSKPLYEQLADLEASKQAEFEANTKKLFAPPKAIDNEEYEFLSSLADIQSKAIETRQLQDNLLIDEYIHKKHNSIDNKVVIAIPKKEKVIDIPLPTVITKRRKITNNDKSDINKKVSANNSNKKTDNQINTSNDIKTIDLFNSYGSDSD